MKSTRYPSLRQLHVFEAVARHKSIGRAAALVGLSQPAVTQAIASLESRFGVTLFERVRSGSYLTDFGKILLARTERLFDFMRQGLRRLPGSHQSSEPADIDTLTGKITTTQIRCLIAVSENLSFDQAARSIEVSQPSLHRAARELERNLRRAIYYRGARGITTTEQGTELARQFKLAMRELDYGSDEIAARQGIVTSRIAIGTLATSGSFGLARAIDEFLGEARGAGVHIVEEPYEQLLDHLRAGNIDVLISVLRRPDWATDVTETMLFEEPYVIVMRPKHPLSAFSDIGRDQLADYDWIVPGPSTPRYLAFERLFASAKKHPTARVSTASRGLIRSLITTSDRLTLLTRHEALLEEKLGVLRIAPTRLRLPRRAYGVATRANWRPTALQQTFLDILIRYGRQARLPDPPHGTLISVAVAALLAALLCFPALAQSPQLGSQDSTSDMRATGPASWFWTSEEWRPTLSSSDGRFTMSFRARLQLDAGWFDQSQDVGNVTPQRDVEFKDLRSGTMTRRAYLGVEGRAFGDFSYEYRMNFGETRSFLTNPIINIARVSYGVGDAANLGESHFRIDAGLIRPMFTYEDSTSSATLMFLERADVVNVATTGYGGGTPRLGFQAIFQAPDVLQRDDNLVVSGSLTGENHVSNNTVFPSNATFEGAQIFGRVAYRLPIGDGDGIQVGASASHLLSVAKSALADGARVITLQDFPEIRVDGNHLVSTGPVPAKGGSLWGVEAAANFRSVYLTGEFYDFVVDRDSNCAGCAGLGDPAFSGWYVAAAWVLTGERRIYQPVSTNNSFATFQNPHLATAFSFSDRNWGALEIAARYSDLDLNWRAGAPQTTCIGAFVGCIRGGEEKIWTFGLNWYLSNNVRMQFDYMAIDVNKLNASGQQVGQALGAIGTRLQLTN